MSTNLIETLNYLANEIQSGYETGKAFAVEQMPLVAREMLLWHLVGNVIYLVIGVIMLLFALKIFRYLVRISDKIGECFMSCGAPFAFIILLVVGSSLTTKGSLAVAKNLCAPRLVLIQEIRSAIR